MPLSKPVKKQQLLLPSPADFSLLGNEKKQHILKRLSTDNLIIYLEHIVGNYNAPTKASHFTLEQIVEDDVRLSGAYADEDSFISDWINKNANRSMDLEASFLDAGNAYGMTSTKAITQALLGSPSKSLGEHKETTDLRNLGGSSGGKAFGDVSNYSATSGTPGVPSSAPNVSSSNGKNSCEIYYSNQSSFTSAVTPPTMATSSRVKNTWDCILPTSTGAGSGSALSSRWLTSTAGGGGLSGKENGATQFKAAIERPSSDLDLRYGTETPSFFGKNGNTFANGKPNSASKSSVLTRTLGQDLFPSSAASMVGLDEKSRHAPYGMPGNSTVDVSLEAPLQPNMSAFAEATSSIGGGFPLRGNHSEYGGTHSLLATPRNHSPLNGNVFNYKQGLENVNSNYSQFDPLFLKGTTSKFESNTKQQQQPPDLALHRFGVSRNLEGAFNSNKSALAEPLVPTSSASVGGVNQKLSTSTLEVKEPTLDPLPAFNLPEPAVFNGLSAESRAKVLASLPVSVKNKYEYYCWSYKLNQLYKERPAGGEELNNN